MPHLRCVLWAALGLSARAAGPDDLASFVQREVQGLREGQDPEDVLGSLRPRVGLRVLRVPMRLPEQAAVPARDPVQSVEPVMMVSKGTVKRKKHKVEFNPFKDMISTINLAINTVKNDLETNAHDFVHSAKDTLQEVGRQLSSENVLSAKERTSLLEVPWPDPNETIAASTPRTFERDPSRSRYVMSNVLPPDEEDLVDEDAERLARPVLYGNSRPRPRPRQ